MVDITYRTLGPWGAGKGANLQPSEVDNNFYSLAQAIVNIQDNPEEPNGIYSITVSGTQMTITLSDGTVLGPYTLPVLTFRWRGEWDAFATYDQLDVFTITNQGIYMVQVAHSGTGAPFDPNKYTDDDIPYFIQLFGSVDASLSALPDVALGGSGYALTDQDFLQWLDEDSKWHNVHLGSMAYQEDNAVIITGGYITGIPSPSLPLDVVNKAYVDALPAGMTAPSPTVMANIIGYVSPAIPHTISDVLDATLGSSVRGNLIYRSDTGWVVLPPGLNGDFLQTHGPGADVTWSAGGSGVTALYEGTGITFGGAYIFATGTISLANIADDTFLANTSGALAAPVPTTLTGFLDSVLGTTRGQIIARGVGGWAALAPGISGQYLKTTGPGTDVAWDSPAGAGTVTAISAGTGISTGGSPITGTGTVSLAAIATGSLLANTTGSTAAPVPRTASVFFDSVFGSTQGGVLYRNASTWVVMTPGTSGQVLTTAGGSANPAWANPAAGAPIATGTLLSNISGSTAVAAGNTLSDIFDSILGASRGMIVYRGASGWVALPPGTAGQVLTTGGPAGNPGWAAGGSGGGGASITVADTAPASPAANSLWWDSAGGQLYLSYDDGTSVQWVPATNQPGPAGPAGPAGPSIPLPVAIASGGTGQTTAAAALTALGGAPLASPALTGNPTAPTPATADSDTSIATTAYVQAQGYATSAAMTTADNLRVLKAGDTMTGGLSIISAGGSANLVLGKSAGANLNVMQGNVAGSPRWQLYIGNNAAETGSDTGSNFDIYRFADGGAAALALTINRATGNATFGGAIGVGVSGTPQAGVHIKGAGQATGSVNVGVAMPNALMLSDSASGAGQGGMVVFAAGDDAWRFAAIKGFATNGANNSQGDIYFSTRRAATDAALTSTAVFTGAGTTLNTSGAWGTISSASVKQDIQPYTRGLNAVLELNPVQFRYVAGTPFSGEDEPSKVLIGLIADDVKPHVPEIVGSTLATIKGKQDVEIDTLEPGNLIYALINAVKELSAKVAALEGGAPIAPRHRQ